MKLIWICSRKRSNQDCRGRSRTALQTEVSTISKEVRVNRRIRAPEVRLIDAEGKQLGVYIASKAIQMAEEQGLDLVEISPNASPPVCKIMDYGKYKYELTKKQKEAKKHQVIVLVKEVKFRPVTDDHDLGFKVRNMERFLEEGHKVKATVVFRGREMSYREGGKKVMETILGMLQDKAIVEVPPKMEGRQMTMILMAAKAAKKHEPAKPKSPPPTSAPKEAPQAKPE